MTRYTKKISQLNLLTHVDALCTLFRGQYLRRETNEKPVVMLPYGLGYEIYEWS